MSPASPDEHAAAAQFAHFRPKPAHLGVNRAHVESAFHAANALGPYHLPPGKRPLAGSGPRRSRGGRGPLPGTRYGHSADGTVTRRSFTHADTRPPPQVASAPWPTQSGVAG